ncbi:hypothetical protein B9Z55_023719 [Caenorhabditis nigoni]|nr:hypothetical protein B9Z55_023719 [Caenorhabditis nigoni]
MTHPRKRSWDNLRKATATCQSNLSIQQRRATLESESKRLRNSNESLSSFCNLRHTIWRARMVPEKLW